MTNANAIFNFEDEVANCKQLDDITGKDRLIQRMLKSIIETMLEKEITQHLGHEKNERSYVRQKNHRNGSTPRTLKTGFGKVKINVLRDRNGTFSSEVVRKYETMSEGLESKVVSMYSKGISTRDTQEYLRDIYGTEIFLISISNITGKIMDRVNEWLSRPLNKVYSIIFLDAICFKVKSDGHIRNRAVYICEGISQESYKDILGIWIGENEGAKFWFGVCNQLKNGGVQDVLVACIDGLTGFPDVIKTVFPSTIIQLCIIHQIRNSLKYVASKEQKEFMKDLELVYVALSEEIALNELDKMGLKWKKYAVVLDS